MDKALDSLPELFYDLIAIFIPGFYCYYCFSLMYGQEVLINAIGITTINETITSLVIIYLVGFILYFFSSYIIARIFNFFFGDPKFILLGAKLNKRHQFLNRYFLRENSFDTVNFYESNIELRIRHLTDNESFVLKDNLDPAFEICRNYVMGKLFRSTTIRKEQAYGEMSRAIVLVSLVSIVWLLILTTFYDIVVTNFNYVMIFYVFSFITFSFRYGQAKHINSVFIYSSFISAVELKNKSNDDKK